MAKITTKPPQILGTQSEIVQKLEELYKKWITDNRPNNSKTVIISNLVYSFLTPNDLYFFIKGAKLFMETK